MRTHVMRIAEIVQANGHLVGDGPTGPLGTLLGKPGPLQALLANDLPLVGGQVAVEELHHGAFPLAIAAEKANSLAALDLELHLIKEQRTAKR